MARRSIGQRTRTSAATAIAVTALLSAACTTVPPGPARVADRQPPATTYSPALGTKTDWSRLGAVKHYLRSLPGGVTFYEVPWCDIEPRPGTFDWSDPDVVVGRAASLGFTTMLKLRVGQCWTTRKSPQYLRGVQQKTESGMPTDLSAYAGFVRRVVVRYSSLGVHEYAVENEVNSPSFWDGSPSEYRRLVNVAARVIHNVDPKAVVLDAGMSSTASGYGVVGRLLEQGATERAIEAYNTYFARRFGTRGEQIVHADSETELSALLDSEQGRRNAAFLATTNRLVGDRVVDARQVHFYERWSALPLLMDYLHAMTPSGTPLEMWETGAYLGTSRLTARRRSAEMVKTIALAVGEGATKAVWIPANVDADAQADEGRLYGLLGSDGQDRAASEAFAAISAAARKAQSVAITGHGIVGVGFDAGGRSTAFVWSTSSPTSLRLPAGSRVHPLTTAGGTGRSERRLVGTDPVQIDLPTSIAEFLAGLG